MENWLLSLDQGEGKLMQYLGALQRDFGSLAEVAAAAIPDATGNSVLNSVDPLIFEALGVQSLGHKLLVAKGVVALASLEEEEATEPEQEEELEEAVPETQSPQVPGPLMRGSVLNSFNGMPPPQEEPPLKRPKQPPGPPPAHVLKGQTLQKARPQPRGDAYNLPAQPPGTGIEVPQRPRPVVRAQPAVIPAASGPCHSSRGQKAGEIGGQGGVPGGFSFNGGPVRAPVRVPPIRPAGVRPFGVFGQGNSLSTPAGLAGLQQLLLQQQKGAGCRPPFFIPPGASQS